MSPFNQFFISKLYLKYYSSFYAVISGSKEKLMISPVGHPRCPAKKDYFAILTFIIFSRLHLLSKSRSHLISR